jgi:hypothetical protein
MLSPPEALDPSVGEGVPIGHAVREAGDALLEDLSDFHASVVP